MLSHLDLHGAMVAEHVDDADGEVLARVRQVGGLNIPIVASLDFHANVSARMVAQADGLVSFRSYPHVDMTETGLRSAALLHDVLVYPSACEAASTITVSNAAHFSMHASRSAALSDGSR